jgi:hypothetical protein
MYYALIYGSTEGGLNLNTMFRFIIYCFFLSGIPQTLIIYQIYTGYPDVNKYKVDIKKQ